MDYTSDTYYTSSEEEDEPYDAYPAWEFEHHIYEGVASMFNGGPLPRLNPDIKCHRETVYDRIEALLEKSRLPPVIESIGATSTAFDFREAAVGPKITDIDAVVPPAAAESWRRFWERRPEIAKGIWTFDNWDNLGEFCLELLDCCEMPINEDIIKSCMIHVLGMCQFLKGPEKPVYGP